MRVAGDEEGVREEKLLLQKQATLKVLRRLLNVECKFHTPHRPSVRTTHLSLVRKRNLKRVGYSLLM